MSARGEHEAEGRAVEAHQEAKHAARLTPAISGARFGYVYRGKRPTTDAKLHVLARGQVELGDLRYTVVARCGRHGHYKRHESPHAPASEVCADCRAECWRVDDA